MLGNNFLAKLFVYDQMIFLQEMPEEIWLTSRESNRQSEADQLVDKDVKSCLQVPKICMDRESTKKVGMGRID